MSCKLVVTIVEPKEVAHLGQCTIAPDGHCNTGGQGRNYCRWRRFQGTLRGSLDWLRPRVRGQTSRAPEKALRILGGPEILGQGTWLGQQDTGGEGAGSESSEVGGMRRTVPGQGVYWRMLRVKSTVGLEDQEMV